MRTRGALAVLLTIGTPSAALAQTHSAEDEAACTPDVLRLCQEFIPNRQAIITCMTAKKAQLGPECGAVFSRPPAARAVDGQNNRSRRRVDPPEHTPK